MGRPALTATEKRSERVTLKLTKEEKQKLDSAAATCGLPAVTIARDKLFKGRFPEPRLAKVDIDAYLELKRIGVNINQLTRLANAGKLPTGLLSCLYSLKANEEKLIRRLTDDSQPENR